MSKVFVDISMSLDGFVAGPGPTLEEPLGAGGEQLHEWAFAALSWREQHGRTGGAAGLDSDLIDEVRTAGATVMGRRMFSGGEGPWEDDPNKNAWWGEEPPFHHPVFVLTHHAREPLPLQGGTTFTFVTDGVESAVAQAREAASGNDVHIAGGAIAAQRALAAGLVDELQVHVVPILLGDGARLFTGTPGGLERTRVLESPTGVTHLRYRVRR